MQSHEYRVLPAPRRGVKAKGLRAPEDRFAHAVESEMNRMAQEGWEFVRSDTLPQEHRPGWFSRPVTVFQTLLVFRRPRPEAATQALRAGAMPPPVALTPPASIAPPPVHVTPLPPVHVAAPAATRFTPPPEAPKPANAAPPTLTLVEPLAPDSEPNSRHAAE